MAWFEVRAIRDGRVIGVWECTSLRLAKKKKAHVRKHVLVDHVNLYGGRTLLESDPASIKENVMK